MGHQIAGRFGQSTEGTESSADGHGDGETDGDQLGAHRDVSGVEGKEERAVSGCPQIEGEGDDRFLELFSTLDLSCCVTLHSVGAAQRGLIARVRLMCVCGPVMADRSFWKFVLIWICIHVRWFTHSVPVISPAVRLLIIT